jgi:hypothetical protein
VAALLEELNKDTVLDDQDPNWENIAFEDNIESDIFGHKDNLISMEKIPSVEEAKRAYTQSVNKPRHFALKLVMLTWYRLWVIAREALKSFDKKIRVLNQYIFPLSKAPH